jgi:hypothetical protein
MPKSYSEVMDTVGNNELERQLSEAKRTVAQVQLPPEVESLTISIGSDAAGEPSLWLQLHVKKEVQANREEVKRLTQFARDVQSTLINAGITLFPYTSLEQAA